MGRIATYLFTSSINGKDTRRRIREGQRYGSFEKALGASHDRADRRKMNREDEKAAKKAAAKKKGKLFYWA